MIAFHIDSRSGIPPYLQIVQQVKHALRLGMLGPGDQLPTIKQVVADVAINPNTVLKAYRDLEREGLVEGRAGVGTFVLDGRTAAVAAAPGALRRSARSLAKSALDAGLDHETSRRCSRNRGVRGIARAA